MPSRSGIVALSPCLAVAGRADQLTHLVLPEVGGPHDRAGTGLGRGALEDEAAEVDDEEVLAGVHDEHHVVLDQQDPDAAFGHDSLEALPESFRLRPVESRGRFLEEEQPLVARVGPGAFHDAATAGGQTAGRGRQVHPVDGEMPAVAGGEIPNLDPAASAVAHVSAPPAAVRVWSWRSRTGLRRRSSRDASVVRWAHADQRAPMALQST